MDNLTTDESLQPKKPNRKKREKGMFARVYDGVYTSIERRKTAKGAIFYDIAVFLIGFLFARCHLLFGAHPLAIAFIAVLPTHVWIATAGSVIGALTLGKAGIIYAMIAVIVVFLRIIVSGTEKEDPDTEVTVPKMFSEGLLLRMSASIIGGFICAVYEILLSGFNMNAVLFGAAMIILPPIITFTLSGLFDADITPDALLFDSAPVFVTRGRIDRERYNIIFFQCAALVLLYLIGLSMAEYSIYGIDISYIFAGWITVLCARRFGPLRACAVGFAAALGLSSSICVAFGLLGLVSGVLFKIGIPYALVGGCAAFIGWCAYSNGIVGVLSSLPEYLICAILFTPFLKKIPAEKTEIESKNTGKEAEDMVGTVALSYKSKYSGALDSLELSLSQISSILKTHGEKSGRPSIDELTDLILECMQKYCIECSGRYLCKRGGINTEREDVDKLSTILYKKGKLYPEDFDTVDGLCHISSGLCEAINRAVSIVMEDRYKAYKRNHSSEEFELISALISEARHRDECEKSLNEGLSASLEDALFCAGLSDGVIKAFGTRAPHFIVAAEDEDGKKISSPELRDEISRISGFALGAPQFYRREKMALMECSADKLYSVSYATASIAGEREAVSGDTALNTESSDGKFFSLISDGMGSGSEAKETSEFVRDFLCAAFDFGAPGQSILKILNHTLRARAQECSATVDLFSFDLYSGEASFIKCGAAPSYIKRDSSIFRITSRTAPIGLMKVPDAEKIKADIKSDDYIIMFSDGITGCSDDAPWLLELLAKPPKKTPREYADHILSVALENLPHTDDMTVSVIQVRR